MDWIIVLLQIILINLVLSGDNAVVIALACRRLPEQHKKKAILIGTAGAIVLRIILTLIAAYLLEIPFIEVLGSLLLLWIAIKLLRDEEDETEIKQGTSFWAAVKTIIIADFVMGLDNVLGVAGAAGGNFYLLIAGLVLSIPIIVWGSTFIMSLMNRFRGLLCSGPRCLDGQRARCLSLTPSCTGCWTITPLSSFLSPFFASLSYWLQEGWAASSKPTIDELPS